MDRTVYRIIDANFNRAREALRVIEEFCRFGLSSAILSAHAKSLRHELSAAISTLDAARLIASRDSQADVGRAMKTPSDMTRTDLYDCFTAAAKRLSEALRALAETSKTIDPALADTLEALRFRGYSLEKEVVLAAATTERFRTVRLYVLLPMPSADDIGRVCDLAEASCRGGADCLQLRAKGVSDRPLYDAACKVAAICREHSVISIINDRMDIALASGADGVHLGQNDLPIGAAQQLPSRPMITGLSTHTIEQVAVAISQCPTYIAVGPVFQTATKPAEPTAGLCFVTDAAAMLSDANIPGVAIGGITLDNVDCVLQAGITRVAVCSAVADSADPAGQCRRLKERLHET